MQTFLPRIDTHARLEPVGTVLHGAGQANGQDFIDYSQVMRQINPAPLPAVYMAYLGVNNQLDSIAKWMETHRVLLAKFHPGVALQVGLSMTKDGTPSLHYEQNVAAGKYDAQLHAILSGLLSLNVPIYLRIGYEFNGHWNGYEPETYRAAFRRIALMARQDYPDLKLATVWCVEPGGLHAPWQQYQPGADVVDWWGVDVFSPEQITYRVTQEYLAAALRAGKPVMIGESTPRYVGVKEGESAWQRWYAPYFDLIHTCPAIKMFCYINWDWSKYPMWQDWGNARIQDNAMVQTNYLQEMQHPYYQHAR